VSYDANGNITKYKRNKDAGVTQDSLNYKYNAGTNQLQYITDNVATNVSTTDIDNQSPNNYIYDKSGNMVADNSQSMSVSWSPYGKILQNNKAGGANLTFGYNAMQQRVLKRVVLAGDTTRTYYIRDAQGNTMGVYTRHNDSVTWREQYIFGSSRLGLYRADTLVNKGLTVISKLYEGKRNYELTNHLGNVMAVINDRKADTTIGVNKGYNAVVISATDYFPFGMAIDSRSYTSALYRYGFNGKENDKETGEQDYGMRIYDQKGCRFLSLDPIGRKFPELSPYQFASNSPIQSIDLDGLEGVREIDILTGNNTMMIDLYFVPKNLPIKTYDQRFTLEQAMEVKEGIMKEFNKQDFFDEKGNKVDLEINIIPISVKSKIEALSKVSIANASYPGHLQDPRAILLEKFDEVTNYDKDGNVTGITMANSTTGILRANSKFNTHANTHELFHDFIHNHPNASEETKKLIDPSNQEPGHLKSGGIFVYKNVDKGIKEQGLNQKTYPML